MSNIVKGMETIKVKEIIVGDSDFDKDFSILDESSGEVYPLNDKTLGDIIGGRSQKVMVMKSFDFSVVNTEGYVKFCKGVSYSDLGRMLFLSFHLKTTWNIVVKGNNKPADKKWFISNLGMSDSEFYRFRKRMFDSRLLRSLKIKGIDCYVVNPVVFRKRSTIHKTIFKIFGVKE